MGLYISNYYLFKMCTEIIVSFAYTVLKNSFDLR